MRRAVLLVFVFVFLPLSALSLGCGGSGRADGDTGTDGETALDGDLDTETDGDQSIDADQHADKETDQDLETDLDCILKHCPVGSFCEGQFTLVEIMEAHDVCEDQPCIGSRGDCPTYCEETTDNHATCPDPGCHGDVECWEYPDPMYCGLNGFCLYDCNIGYCDQFPDGQTCLAWQPPDDPSENAYVCGRGECCDATGRCIPCPASGDGDQDIDDEQEVDTDTVEGDVLSEGDHVMDGDRTDRDQIDDEATRYCREWMDGPVTLIEGGCCGGNVCCGPPWPDGLPPSPEGWLEYHFGINQPSYWQSLTFDLDYDGHYELDYRYWDVDGGPLVEADVTTDGRLDATILADLKARLPGLIRSVEGCSARVPYSCYDTPDGSATLIDNGEVIGAGWGYCFVPFLVDIPGFDELVAFHEVPVELAMDHCRPRAVPPTEQNLRFEFRYSDPAGTDTHFTVSNQPAKDKPFAFTYSRTPPLPNQPKHLTGTIGADAFIRFETSLRGFALPGCTVGRTDCIVPGEGWLTSSLARSTGMTYRSIYFKCPPRDGNREFGIEKTWQRIHDFLRDVVGIPQQALP